MRWTWPFKSRNGNHRNGHRSNGHKGNGDDLNGATGTAHPDFLCVGAQKAGTSWLYRQLEPHPDFWMPPIKELHYLNQLNRTKQLHGPRCADERDASFLDSMQNLRGRFYLDLDSYGRLFQHKGECVSGDISPAYSTLNDEIIERVVNHFPKLKVVFLARDPVERAWSQLSMGVRLGMINKFDATDPEEVVRNLLIPGVLARSHPSKIVARWKRYVRPENFRVYFFDDLNENPAELRQSILSFLGGDPDKPSGRLKPQDNNDAGRDKLRLTAKVRDRMAQFFEHELKACAAKLGGRARSWPTRYGFSLLLYFWDLLDDSIDLFFWCDWIC
ncbi:MAG TPA: sulfotransferase domain-containing protein [Candidatus Udaeobacter sp.]